MERIPYEKYKKLKAWKIIEKELNELVENQDLQITTLPDLVVASLVECLKENNLLKDNFKEFRKDRVVEK